MKRLLLSVVSLLFVFNLTLAEFAMARGGGHSSGGHSSKGYSSKGQSSGGKYSRGQSTSRNRSAGTHSFKESSKATPGVKRDSHGRIARSSKAKQEFMK